MEPVKVVEEADENGKGSVRRERDPVVVGGGGRMEIVFRQRVESAIELLRRLSV